MSDSDVYHQQLLDIYKDPPHFGQLDHPDLILTESNASCGDSFTFYLKFNPKPPRELNLPLTKGNLEEFVYHSISFSGQGCVISTVASALLADHLIGKPFTDLHHLDQTFMETLLGITITPARLKCLLLPVTCLKSAAT